MLSLNFLFDLKYLHLFYVFNIYHSTDQNNVGL